MAGDEGGYLLTRLVRVTHPHLRVNLTLPTTVGARTDFQAELLAPDERGVAHPVPGYTFDDCATQPSTASMSPSAGATTPTSPPS